ncbi:MAG: ImuA family protein [Devosia sp.]
MDRSHDVRALRTVLARLDPSVGDGGADALPRFALGVPGLDADLGGGLVRGGLHEVFAQGPMPAAAGFAAGLALRAAAGRPLVWIRQAHVGAEAGELYAQGLAEMGIDPGRMVLVRVKDMAGVLRAGSEALACKALGAVVMESWGQSRHLDLTATRRLGLAGAETGVTPLMLRVAADPIPSAAQSRWQAGAATSRDLPGLPGLPAFAVELLRLRSGAGGRPWRLEWDHEAHSFREQALSGGVVSLPLDRPAAQAGGSVWRQAG